MEYTGYKKRSNLIPITRIYDIYPKYTYSVDVKRFMDEIVDIDRVNVYTEDEVISMLTELQQEIEDTVKKEKNVDKKWSIGLRYSEKIIQQKINELKRNVKNGDK